MRTLAREAVFKFIFSQLFNQDDEGLFSVLIKELNTDDKSFAKQLLDFILTNEEKYSQVISDLAIGYKLNRLYNADKCALMLGIAELDNFPNTPVAVIIDEAVSLSAKYSTEGSTNFVNGILSEYVRRK